VPEVPIRAFIVSLVAIREGRDNVEVLLLKRTQSLEGEWCQIAGSIEENETAWQAALRELREETGLEAVSLYSADICEQFYEPHRDAITMSPVFVAYIDNEADVKLNFKHSDYVWVSFDGAVEMVAFGGQRRVLRWIRDEFVLRKPSHHLRIEFG